MSWLIEYDPEVSKDLRKLDRSIQREIFDYMERRIGRADDPRQFGKPLRGSKFGLWRYRLRHYRIVCQLQDKRFVVLVVSIGHRSTVYEECQIERLEIINSAPIS